MKARRSGIGFLIPAALFPVAPGLWGQEPIPLSIEEALSLAEAESEQVAIAQAGVARADADVLRARAARLPEVSVSGLYQRALASQFEGLGGNSSGGSGTLPPECESGFTPDSALPLEARVGEIESWLRCPSDGSIGGLDLSRAGFGSENTYDLGLSVSWSAFAGGRLGAQQRVAEAGRDMAESGLTSAEAQVRLDVTQAYFDAQLADALLETAESALAQSDEVLRLTELRAQEGTQADFEVLRARVFRDNQRPVTIRRRARREIAYDRLRLLLNLPAEQPLDLTTRLDSVVGRNDYDTVVESRLPVRQAAERVRMQEGEVDVAASQRLPSLTLSSQYGQVAFPSDLFPTTSDFRDDWTVSASVQFPLFTGGRLRGEVQAAEADLDEARAQLRQTEELAMLDTRSAWAELHAAVAAWEAVQGTVEEAERAYEIAELRYAEGVSSQMELDDSREQLRQARVNRAQAARDLRVAEVRVALLPYLPISTQNGSGSSTPASADEGLRPPSDTQPTR